MKTIYVSNRMRGITSGLDIICRKLNLTYEISENPDFSGINICSPEEIAKSPIKSAVEFLQFLSKNDLQRRWNCIYKTDEGGFILCGDRKIDIFFALLKALDHFDEELREINVSRFDRLYENFDDFYSGFARAADDFDLEVHMIDLVRSGIECFEINTLYDDIPIQIREREHKNDVYPWWCTYSPSLDMFYESKLTKGIYSDKMLDENRKVLIHNAQLASALGMAPVFTTFEPRVCPERLFRKYPEIRGARVDFDAYSAIPEYGLDPTHPLVLDHFAELIEKLMQDVPDLALYEIWSQDSNASFPWADCSYMKRNGPTRLFNKSFSEIVNPLLVRLHQTVSQYNPETRININLDWVFSVREKEELLRSLPNGVGATFGFATLTKPELPFMDILKEKDKGQVQYIYENVAHAWKRYAPLVGFPFPRSTYSMLSNVKTNGVQNLTLRGGLCTDVFVPQYINNEVLREMKYREIPDIESFLVEQSKKLAASDTEAKVINEVWGLCDEFHAQYWGCRVNEAAHEKLHWTTSMFVSPRTLFRKLVWPIVPNLKILTFAETRYYRPQMFYTHDTDPSWNDMSYFNFNQMVSDDMMRYTVEKCETILLPYLEKALAKINTVQAGEYLQDLRDRITCMLYITRTERAQMRVQYLTHDYLNSDDPELRAYCADEIRQEMINELDNVNQFIALLETSEAILIPTTSGEETTYMYKAPMSQHLKCKRKVMLAHLNDKPGGYQKRC